MCSSAPLAATSVDTRVSRSEQREQGEQPAVRVVLGRDPHTDRPPLSLASEGNRAPGRLELGRLPPAVGRGRHEPFCRQGPEHLDHRHRGPVRVLLQRLDHGRVGDQAPERMPGQGTELDPHRDRQPAQERAHLAAVGDLVGAERQHHPQTLDPDRRRLEEAEAARVAPLEVVDRHHDPGGLEDAQRGPVQQDAAALRIRLDPAVVTLQLGEQPGERGGHRRGQPTGVGDVLGHDLAQHGAQQGPGLGALGEVGTGTDERDVARQPVEEPGLPRAGCTTDRHDRRSLNPAAQRVQQQRQLLLPTDEGDVAQTTSPWTPGSLTASGRPAEQALVEVPGLGRGIDPELVGQRLAMLLVDPERRCPVARGAQGLHQRADRDLAQRLGLRRPASQLDRGLGIAVLQGEHGGALEGPLVGPQELRPVVDGPVVVRLLRQRVALPQGERATQVRGRQRLGSQRGQEPLGVDQADLAPGQRVPALPGEHQRGVAERAPGPVDQHLQVGDRVGGPPCRATAPRSARRC